LGFKLFFMETTQKKLSKKQADSLDFEISFYEGVLKNNPNYTDALVAIGDDYTKRGLYEKGLAVDLRLSKLLPYDPYVFYNLACSYSLLNNIEASVEAILKALSLGYKDIKWMNKDPDLENLRNDARYNSILKCVPKKKYRQNVYE